MNTTANMGPVQVAALAYFLCAVISMGVAGIIAMLSHILKAKTPKKAEPANPAT